MGNHEYCAECGEDDFHYGQPCDPEKKAAVDRDKERVKLEIENRIKKIKNDLPKFLEMGYRVNDWDLNREYGYIKLWPN